MKQADLICTDLLPEGTWVMLTEDAPLELKMLAGSEAVMRIVIQSAGDLVKNADGDLICTRKYWVEHQHRGRLMGGISELYLKVIDPASAQGQKLLHDEMTRDFLMQLPGLLQS